MKISIIIPVYNVEQYIAKCLHSCLNQDGVIIGKDYEIIVVDDGSPDDSINIANEILHNITGVKIIRQQNGGLSSARNTGLAHAKGNHIWFIDSDDWITQNILTKIIKQLPDDIDILELPFQYVYEDGSTVPVYQNKMWDGVITGKEVMKSYGISTPAQFTIYRRQFLIDNNLKFVEGIYHEDSELKPRILYFSKKCKCFDSIAYNYLQRSSGSITSAFSIKRGIDSIHVMNNLYSFLVTNSINDKAVIRYFGTRIGLTLNSVLRGTNTLPSKDKQFIWNKLLHNKHLFSTMRNSNNIKYKLEGVILQLYSFFFN